MSDAHSKGKPWHDAKPGELWDVDGKPRAVMARLFGQPPTFADPFAQLSGYPVTSTNIHTARRIWPEAKS